MGKLNQRIAQDCLTAIDDGTIANAWGSLNIDDEGMPTEKTVLIEYGMLKNYMSDRIGAQQVGVPRTGSARRQSYQFAPVSRMRNTYIAPGKSSLDNMLRSIDDGLCNFPSGCLGSDRDRTPCLDGGMSVSGIGHCWFIGELGESCSDVCQGLRVCV